MNQAAGAPARPSPRGSNVVVGLLGAAIAIALGYFFISQRPVAPARPAATLTGPPVLPPCVMDKPGYLSGEIFGSISLTMDWQGSALSCDGNRRPQDKGLRLFFAGHLEGGADQIVLVLGIDASAADFGPREYPVNVTLIDESAGGLYHSGPDRCWTRVTELVGLDHGRGQTFRVDGEIYCVGAIPSLSDQGSITLGEIAYSGRLRLGGA